jgi:hypothetical protein
VASEVDICNMALQKLGAARITSLEDNSRNARACNACYALLRDKELRAHPWNFARKRDQPAPLADAPAFGYLYAFPLPNDFLRLVLPHRAMLDWKLENQDGQRVILTNDGDSINVRYVARITDTTAFDPTFVEALACKLAWHMCEEITQSNDKKAAALNEYKQIIAEARSTNAMENTAEEAPPDTWDLARLFGSADINYVRATYGNGLG